MTCSFLLRRTNTFSLTTICNQKNQYSYSCSSRMSSTIHRQISSSPSCVLFSSPTPTPTTTISVTSSPPASSSSSSSEVVFKNIYGGDFAGHSATFSSQTGALIPVPEYLLPPSMVEWDSIPSCFEIITSEDIGIIKDTEEEFYSSSSSYKIHRNIVTVVPEVGCGIDNLDTLKTVESWNVIPNSIQGFSTNDTCNPIINVAASTISNTKHNNKNLETTFAFHTKSIFKRIRLSFDIDIHHYTFTSPIRIAVERQTSTTSTKGQIAKGGGLDGRTVATLIGKDLLINHKPFSDTLPLPYNETIQALFVNHHPNNHDLLLSLPGNMILKAYRTKHDNHNEFIIRVIHLLEKQHDDDYNNQHHHYSHPLIQPIQVEWRVLSSS